MSSSKLYRENAVVVSPDLFSLQALELFWLIWRLSRPTGSACVRLISTLAAMLGKSERATRYALAELIAGGAVERIHTRKGGRCLTFLTPLVTISTKSPGRFKVPERPRTVAKSTPQSAPAEVLQEILHETQQDSPRTPFKEDAYGDGQETTNPQGVVVQETESPAPPDPSGEGSQAQVALIELGICKPLAIRLARGKDPQRILAAVQAVRKYQKNHLVRNLTALVVTALRDGWTPPALVPEESRHPAGRIVRAPEEYLRRCDMRSHRPKSPGPDATSPHATLPDATPRAGWENLRKKLFPAQSDVCSVRC